MPATSYNQPVRPEDPDAEYLTLQEFAWVMKCSVKTLRRRINEDGYPHSRSGGGRAGRIVISREDRRYYYEANRRMAAAPIRRSRSARQSLSAA
ncbi:hypothetical protein GCM10010331_49950 [Streptomyces xanthochromogenes]|uniref:hypothetical protein n=1 Tax=Streptomyces xanthochromogenes TaxID=67384 RepID=UPI0016799585|nr:hypothetical protein [Streptomyces xanthochromogenes]GHB56065.1 hypothetical protein GCM10010331_49950 [Streptomyces xanthochromogenes]